MSRDNLIFSATLEAAFETAGLTFPSKPMAPGKFSRFSDGHKKNDTAGFCKIFLDGQGATFGSNRGTSYIWQQRDIDAPKPSQADRDALRAKFAELRKQDEIDTAKPHRQHASHAIPK